MPATPACALTKKLANLFGVRTSASFTRNPFARSIVTRNRRCGRLERLEDRLLLSVSAEEQLFVYLLNEARHDPVAYQEQRGLSVDLSYIPSRGPLAINDDLFDSARFHADEMATHDYFAHQSEVTGDWPNKMVRDQGYALPSSWSDSRNYVESIAAGTSDSYTTAARPLKSLIVDRGISSLGHRHHLLGYDAPDQSTFHAVNREIGVGYAYDAASSYESYWAIHIANTSPADRFLTGVVFDDLNDNGRYDLDEGLAGVTVAAGGLSTITNAHGGWSIQTTIGSHTVTASGGAFTGTATAVAVVEGENVEVDFISGMAGGMVDFQPRTSPPPDPPPTDTPPIDTARQLGTIDFDRQSGLDPASGDLWFRFTALRDGVLTAELSDAGATVTLLAGAGNPQTLATGVQRVDFAKAVGGAEYFLQVSGLGSAAELTLANLVAVGADASQVTVHGTDGDDSFEIAAGAPHVVIVNGLRYEFESVASLRAVGRAGNDQVTLTATAANESAVLRPTLAVVTGPGYEARLDGFSSITLHGGGGGDVARMHDSAGNDHFVATPVFAALRGQGFDNQVEHFNAVHAYAGAGGVDVAKFHDSRGDDEFVATPINAALFNRTYVSHHNTGFYNRAKFFEGVHAFATAGGVDVARFYDSPANDNFVATPVHAALFNATYREQYTNGFYNRAKYFEAAHAFGTAAEHDVDVARMYDSPGDDRFYADPTQAALFNNVYDGAYNTRFYNRAKFFQGVHAFATAGQNDGTPGGHDTAYLHGSDASDRFHAGPDQGAMFRTGEFYNRAKFFEEVHADAHAGADDRAFLSDSSLSDLLEADGDRLCLSNAVLDFLYETKGFDHVTAEAGTSDNTCVLPDLAQLEFALDLEGPW